MKASPPHPVRGRLFRKYAAAFVAVVCFALGTNGLVDIIFSYQEQRALLMRIQQTQAESAAANISQFVKEIEDRMEWATLLPWNAQTLDEWRFDAVRLLREVPAISVLTQLDQNGRELFRMSQQASDVIASRIDHSQEPEFIGARINKVYYGPVYFLDGSEPYMTLALGGQQPENGVIVAQVNLEFIWDVVSKIKVGQHGLAYVVDSHARLIAHPDISLVLRNLNLSGLPQVQAAGPTSAPTPVVSGAPVDLQNKPVLSVHAVVAPLRWLVFVDLPIDEAYAPLYQSIKRSGILLLGALSVALAAAILLARRMIVPIRALHDGAARIGGGDLAQRISIQTGDEVEELGNQFNSMAMQLQESYATLERKVEERTRQLEIANQAKSRFLATASHDLRQPLHALGLFVAQLRGRTGVEDRKRIVAGIEAALSAVNELFNALLDISKLDAGVLVPKLNEFPVAQLLKRIETTFAGVAREKGLDFRVISSDGWVRSDFILLERIVFNLVSNAIRYTSTGGVLVGCRRRGKGLRIEVWDTGAGIPHDQHQYIFSEFYRLEKPDQDPGGLGLGLAIVDRLCRLLKHPVDLKSKLGKGSCFRVTVPLIRALADTAKPRTAARPTSVALDKRLVVVIDDDPLVLEGMGG